MIVLYSENDFRIGIFDIIKQCLMSAYPLPQDEMIAVVDMIKISTDPKLGSAISAFTAPDKNFILDILDASRLCFPQFEMSRADWTIYQNAFDAADFGDRNWRISSKEISKTADLHAKRQKLRQALLEKLVELDRLKQIKLQGVRRSGDAVDCSSIGIDSYVLREQLIRRSADLGVTLRLNNTPLSAVKLSSAQTMSEVRGSPSQSLTNQIDIKPSIQRGLTRRTMDPLAGILAKIFSSSDHLNDINSAWEMILEMARNAAENRPLSRVMDRNKIEYFDYIDGRRESRVFTKPALRQRLSREIERRKRRT